MTKQLKISGVPIDAPLFRGAKPEDLEQVVEYLSSASYHYADDSAKEWGTARAKVLLAAVICARHRLGLRAIEYLHKHKSQLVPLDEIVDCTMDMREVMGLGR